VNKIDSFLIPYEKLIKQFAEMHSESNVGGAFNVYVPFEEYKIFLQRYKQTMFMSPRLLSKDGDSAMISFNLSPNSEVFVNSIQGSMDNLTPLQIKNSFTVDSASSIQFIPTSINESTLRVTLCQN